MITIEKFVKNVVATSGVSSLAEVARLMEQHNVGAVVIAEMHKPIGIVTDRDLALQIGVHGRSLQTRVETIMSKPVKTAGRDDGVFDTTRTMMEYRVRRLPVVDDDGFLVGLVTFDDLVRLLSRELSHLAGSISEEMVVK